MNEKRAQVGNVEIKWHEDGSVSFKQHDDYVKIKHEDMERFLGKLNDEVIAPIQTYKCRDCGTPLTDQCQSCFKVAKYGIGTP